MTSDEAPAQQRPATAVYEFDVLPPAGRRMRPGDTGAFKHHVRAADEAEGLARIQALHPGATVTFHSKVRDLEAWEIEPVPGGGA